MKISLIAAVGKNRELGKENKLLWHIPEDFKRFREITSGHPIIMGRKTFESIGRPLPNRLNIIISRSLARSHLAKLNDIFIVHSLGEAIDFAEKKEIRHSGERSDSRIDSGQARMTRNSEIFIIGGGQIFEQSISLADKLYLTVVDGEFSADTFFPDYSDFKKIVFEKNGESKDYKYKFLELER